MIKVSVLITSYNRADKIRRAIESVLSQVTNFKVQVVIIDDGSTDNSVEVIRQTIKEVRHQDWYIDFFPLKHQGMMETYLRGFRECKGEYLTFCDCDDYWIDDHRLQKQLEYMEANKDCGICFTRAAIEGLEPGLRYSKDDLNLLVSQMTFDNLLRGNSYVYAQTYFIRRSVFDKYINISWYYRMYVWDYPIVLKLINHTKFGYLDFHSAVFTINGESFTNVRTRQKRWEMIKGQAHIKWFFIRQYGCKFSTKMYLIYWFARSIYSIIFKRWYK